MIQNIPEVKLGLIAVSRGCFPMALAERRRTALHKACKTELYECPVTVENECDARKAVDDVLAHGVRDVDFDQGVENAFDFPGFVPAYIRPLFCRGIGPFRWAALSGDPEDIWRTDAKVKELIPDNPALHRWLDMAAERIHFQGLPARICWLGHGERDAAGLRFNELVASGDISAPIVIGRDHLDSGSVASPYRETEAMADGSDAIADWPLLNALLNTASGASWVSIHHGGGVGIGRSIHAGQVCVADGTPLAGQKIERVLTNDPGTGVIRHVDAGYESQAASGVHIPMRRDAQ